jgi:hypothetical protein
MAGEDFVEIKLTLHGEKIAGGTKLEVCDGGRHFVFTPGGTVKVTRSFEWERILKDHKIDGEPLFEEIETPKARRSKASE